ncbi:MAG: right-handed parallel beta-helix repeat-containing protein [Phycisphaeraceae bacterium]|nr:right-handed parallel beta-helix repeat-containing protein [Phycisphaeraceae bacterium]
MLCTLLVAALTVVDPPVVRVTADNTEITHSCIVEIDPAATIADADGNGVIHIRTSGISLQFKDGSALWGGPRPAEMPDGPWDRYAGIGVRIDGAHDVTIRGARIHGFKVGIWATECDRLTIEGADLSDNYRQRLKSTPEAEDSSDWLFPHRNDNDEWATQHGAAVYIRRALQPRISGVRVRRGQNGILLHSVGEGWLYDNDCSFLSGWGLGMFRSSFNQIERNAFDFCVRGHSEGVYNRGQDSAGILMFEQCSNNTIVENSCTHGGDGIFGFAGLEAVNGEGAAADFDFARKGCNDNLFAGNDLSYAPAHGLEMTFSFGNRIIDNRFVENAICGIWGGYSQDTIITRNEFVGNGGMAYGLERGGVNIEHGANNLIIANDFINNRCGVHLWWDPHGDFEEKAWGKTNYKGVRGNVIAHNTFTIDASHPFGRIATDRSLVGLHIRDEGDGSRIRGTVYAGNTATVDTGIGVERVVPAACELMETWDGNADTLAPRQELPRIGKSRPVGARPHLRGRHNIVMGQWGPWDHESPMVRLRSAGAATHTYEVFGAGDDLKAEPELAMLDSVEAHMFTREANRRGAPREPARLPVTVTIARRAQKSGVFPYDFTLHTRGTEYRIRGTIIAAEWDAAFFAWDEKTDPRTDLAAWRALAASTAAQRVTIGGLDLAYGNGGPRDQPWAGPDRDKFPGRDHFGMIARTRLTLGKGAWRFTTLSDDGIRVLADGQPIIENWTWHAPTRDSGLLTLTEEREVEIVVEHFEIDGYAVLSLDIARVQ